MSDYKEVNVNDIVRLNEESGGLMIVDVRTRTEFFACHAAIAKNIPLDQLTRDAVLAIGLKVDDPIYLICRSGGRSAQGCLLLAEAGFKNVFNIIGGTAEWENLGFPVCRAEKGD